MYLFTDAAIIYSVFVVGFFPSQAQEEKHLVLINEANFPVSCSWKALACVLVPHVCPSSDILGTPSFP